MSVCTAGKKGAAHQSIIVKLPNNSVQSLSGANGLAAVGNKSAEEAPGVVLLKCPNLERLIFHLALLALSRALEH